MSLILPKAGPECKSCPLFKKGIVVQDRYSPQHFEGLALVGQIPGRDEVRQHTVFIGPTGKTTDSTLRMFNADPGSVYFTNCIKCGLPNGAMPEEKEAEKAMECCQPLVLENLRRVGPKAVCLLGAIPLRALTSLQGITKYRGCILETEDPWYLTSTFHPASVLRRKAPQQNFDIIYYDLKKAWELSRGLVEPWEPDIRDSSDEKALIEFLRDVHKRRLPLAVDVETTDDVAGRIDAYTARLETVGIAAMRTQADWSEAKGDERTEAWSIPWPGAYPKFYSPKGAKTIVTLLKKIFSDPKQHLIFHNKLFDVPVLERFFEMEIDAIRDDTLLLHHAVYPKTSHTLQQVASQFLVIHPWKDNFKEFEQIAYWRERQVYLEWEKTEDDEEMDSLQKRAWDLSHDRFEELLKYNASDAAATLDIYTVLIHEARTDGLLDVYERDRRLVDRTMAWTEDGIGIDLVKRQKLDREYSKRIDEKEAELRELCTLEPFAELAPRIKAAEDEVNSWYERARELGRIATLLRKGPDHWKSRAPYIAKQTAKLEAIEDQPELFEGGEEARLKATQKLRAGIARAERDMRDMEQAEEALERHGDDAEQVASSTVPKARAKAKEARKKLQELRKTPTKETFNPRSGDHIRLIVMRRGVIPTKVTKKAHLPSVSKDSLWPRMDDEFVAKLFDWREDYKLWSTYIKNLHKKLGPDGRLHPQYKLASTPSGRFGMTPAANTWPYSMREMMVASPGCKIVGADYNALELRVVSLLSGEPEWIRVFSEEGDLHEIMAARYFPDEFPQVNKKWHAFKGTEKEKDEAFPRRKELRGRGKNVTFGDIYLAGAQTLYEQIRSKMPDVKTKEQHEKLRREVMAMQRVLRASTPCRMKWANSQSQIAKECGYLNTTRWIDTVTEEGQGGRIRKWPIKEDPNENANHPIQGMAADIINASTERLVARLEEEGIYRNGAWIILQVHDAWYVEAEEQYAELVKGILEETMYCEITYTSPVTGEPNTMHFTAEAKIGDSVAEV